MIFFLLRRLFSYYRTVIITHCTFFPLASPHQFSSEWKKAGRDFKQ